MTSASSLVMLVVATAVGGIAGIVLGGAGLEEFFIALITAFIGVIAAAAMRNFILVRLARSGPDHSGIPSLIVVFSGVASVAGGMSAHEILQHVPGLPHSLLGALAGLLSALLMIMLMAAYELNPGRRGS